jgi:hypothetical protein
MSEPICLSQLEKSCSELRDVFPQSLQSLQASAVSAVAAVMAVISPRPSRIGCFGENTLFPGGTIWTSGVFNGMREWMEQTGVTLQVSLVRGNNLTSD